MSEKYAVYMVVYFGKALPEKTNMSCVKPRRYIGSSKLSNIQNGYLGSVTSKKYKNLWDIEKRNNPKLFRIRILSTHDNDVEAREAEKIIQIKHNVVKSDLYVNLSISSPRGYFGRPDTGRIFSTETKMKMSVNRKGKTYEEIFGEEKAKELREMRRNQKPHNKGKKADPEWVRKSKESMKGLFFITNGVEDRKIKDESLIPEGWKKGRTNGVANSQNTSFKREDVKIKSRQTKMERYGDPNYNNPHKNRNRHIEEK